MYKGAAYMADNVLADNYKKAPVSTAGKVVKKRARSVEAPSPSKRPRSGLSTVTAGFVETITNVARSASSSKTAVKNVTAEFEAKGIQVVVKSE